VSRAVGGRHIELAGEKWEDSQWLAGLGRAAPPTGPHPRDSSMQAAAAEEEDEEAQRSIKISIGHSVSAVLESGQDYRALGQGRRACRGLARWFAVAGPAWSRVWRFALRAAVTVGPGGPGGH
jgi:hypothetical protein